METAKQNPISQLSSPDLETYIKTDNKLVHKLFTEFEGTGNPEAKLEVAHRLIREICIHNNAEVLTLYPALKQWLKEDLMKEAIDETVAIEQLMYKLDSMKHDDGQLVPLMSRLKTMILDHTTKEEESLLPKLKTAMPPKAWMDLGSQFHSKKSMVPTRPHPDAPKGGMGGKMAAYATKPIDEMKDLIRNSADKKATTTSH